LPPYVPSQRIARKSAPGFPLKTMRYLGN
jgi:hypothetical protein